MAERKIVGRKSQMFLHSVIPVANTHDELVKKKLKMGKFPFTVSGIMKLTGIVFLIISVGIFLSNSVCPDTPEWFPYLLPGVLGTHIILSLLLYVTFSLGITTNNPGVWIKIDISINLSLSIASIISSILSMVSCSSRSSLIRIPMILGLCGGSVLIVSCAATFLLYRFKEDDEHETLQGSSSSARTDPRKSIFA